MTHHAQFKDKLGGADKFQVWKDKISLILKENHLDRLSLEMFENQREMRIRLLITEAWIMIRESLYILLIITSSPMCLHSRHQRNYIILWQRYSKEITSTKRWLWGTNWWMWRYKTLILYSLTWQEFLKSNNNLNLLKRMSTKDKL